MWHALARTARPALEVGNPQRLLGLSGNGSATDVNSALDIPRDGFQISDKTGRQGLRPLRDLRDAWRLWNLNRELNHRIEQQVKINREMLVAHFNGQCGGVTASCLKEDAWYHDHVWGRDAGLVMMEILSEPISPDVKKHCIEKFLHFDNMFRGRKPSYPGDLGQAMTDIFGNPPKQWSDPQHDAPALKAAALADIGFFILENGGNGVVIESIYPAVRQYLNWLMEQEGQPSFDVWEQVKAERHLWTDIAKLVGFSKGADLAQKLGQSEAEKKYRRHSQRLRNTIGTIFLEDQKNQMLFPHKNICDDSWGGKSNVDAQVLGAILLGVTVGCPIPLDHPYTMKSVCEMIEISKQFPYNNDPQAGIGVFRFFEDPYKGPKSGMALNIGGPWAICTLWLGQYYHELARLYSKQGCIDFRNHGSEQRQNLELLLGQTLPAVSVIEEGTRTFNNVMSRLGGLSWLQGEWVMNRIHDGQIPEQYLRETGQREIGEYSGIQNLAWSLLEFSKWARGHRSVSNTWAGPEWNPGPIAQSVRAAGS